MTRLETALPADVARLLGVWAYEREIDDRLNGRHGQVTGEMIFTAEDERIRWAETGILSWGEARTPVTRTLYLIERAGGWIVTFADGRYFHDWRPGIAVQHPCGADHYAGLIDVASDPGALMITWDVTGPAKDYTITTRLTRPRATGTRR